MEFINIKPYKIKKSINIAIPILLGMIILIGNIISATGYNFSVPKSFAKETQITSGIGASPHHLHHSSLHTAARQSGNDSNSNSQKNSLSSPVNTAAGQSILSIDPTAMSVPFGGVSGVSGSLPILGSVISHSSSNTNPLCTVIKQTSFNSTISKSLCKTTSSTSHPTFTFTKTLTKSKNINSKHSYTRYQVVGPDNFKFINSYWTTSNTPRAIDVGTSANNTHLGVSSQSPNTNIETDKGAGPSTLAIELQYEGVQQLAGITAALKLPTGFKSILPLIHDTGRYDIAFSNYRGHIYPGQGIVLYFPIVVLNNVQVQKPNLAPLALHFLKTDRRTATDNLDASEQDQFASTLIVKNASSPFSNGGSGGFVSAGIGGNSIGFSGSSSSGPSTTTFNDNGNFLKDFNKINERVKPFDFVNQVIPVIFAITGQELFSVVIGSGPDGAVPASPVLALLPPGVPTPIKIIVKNTGDVPIYNLNAAASVRDESAISATVVPSTVNIPNVVQQNAVEPAVLIGGQSKQVGFLPVNGTAELDITAVPSLYSGGTVEPIFVTLNFNNAVGQATTLVKRVGVEILPVSAQTALQNAVKIPHGVSNNVINLPNTISNNALHILSNNIANQQSHSLNITPSGSVNSGSSTSSSNSNSGSSSGSGGK